MPIVKTPDGRYTFAIETKDEGDGNSVVYDRNVPVWDRFSYESGETPPPKPGQPDVDPPSIPDRPPTPPSGFQRGLIKVTGPQDGQLINRGYSYYSQVWIGQSGRAYVFAGHADGKPRFYSVTPGGDIQRIESQIPYRGEAECWYFDREGWVFLPEGPRLRRVNPFTGGDVVVFDVSELCPGCDIWQPHSTDGGTVHSATVRKIVSEGKYPYVNTVVHRRGELRPFPPEGDLDESILTKDDRDPYLIIQENNNNRIIRVNTEEVTRISDLEGALAHIDTGPDFMVGEADKPDPGRCDLYYFPLSGSTLFNTLNMGHISVRNGVALLTDATSLYRVDLHGRGRERLIDHGMWVEDPNRPYDFQTFGNLDYTGRIAAFLSNAAGRLDLYLYVL